MITRERREELRQWCLRTAETIHPRGGLKSGLEDFAAALVETTANELIEAMDDRADESSRYRCVLVSYGVHVAPAIEMQDTAGNAVDGEIYSGRDSAAMVDAIRSDTARLRGEKGNEATEPAVVEEPAQADPPAPRVLSQAEEDILWLFSPEVQARWEPDVIRDTAGQTTVRLYNKGSLKWSSGWCRQEVAFSQARAWAESQEPTPQEDLATVCNECAPLDLHKEACDRLLKVLPATYPNQK